MGNRSQYDEVFGGLGNGQFSYSEPGNISEYYNFVEGLDIGLAPLLDTPYNNCRSDVKFVEYASRGVVPVLSAVGPYGKHARHGVNAFLFEDHESLRGILERLVNDICLVDRVSSDACEYVRNERLEKDHAMERISFYNGLANRRFPGAIPFSVLQKVSTESMVFNPTQTPSEMKVLEGARAEAAGEVKEARRLWEEARHDLPGYIFPLICLGESLLKEGNGQGMYYLREVLSYHPQSLRARLLLGQALREKNPKQACKEFESTLRVFPDFAPAWKEISLLAKQNRDYDKAVAFLNKALEVNPFCADAAFELGKIYIENEKIPLAINAFQVATSLIADNPDYQASLIEALARRSDRESSSNRYG